MEKHHLSAVLLFMVPAFLSLAASSSFIGRILLQTQQDCPVDFGRSDITILISKCKGPEYPTEACCDAFKKFACPYADILNDLNNNCATGFSSINASIVNEASSALTLTLTLPLPCPLLPSSPRHRLVMHYMHCPVDFGKLDYVVLTSQCKGPKYPAGPCCSAFKEFACPYADLLNDPSNNCATSMFNYIHQYYPPGIFAEECPDSERGVECPESPHHTTLQTSSYIL
ncbi:hypothetical protein Cgig2_002322 [Carnegiea gigantea]|uniref:GPI-anchored protein LLG1-like domain-containing protein n=1 Tax=Carnegiea gigantea TaxID=171969 RepID=A0A9Q1Q9W3_9CARY|nr:hypothetical protein Cgig2_002322 [Carnegiea gigantea]